MSHHILLLAKSNKSYQFIQQILDRPSYNLKHISVDEFKNASPNFKKIELIILEAIPLSSSDLQLVYTFKKESSNSQIPILALIEEKPARLRYRLVEMGVDDYLTVPFDRMDLKVKVKNLVRLANNNHNIDSKRNISTEPKVKSNTNQLLDEFNKSLQSLNAEDFINQNLLKLKEILNAHSVLLFESQDDDLLTLNSDIPETVFNDLLEFNIPEFPLLEKAVRFKEPIFLNRPSLENVFISYLNSVLQIQISGICIYPLIINNETKFVLVILKTDWEIFTNDHFVVIEFFSELLRFKKQFVEVKQKEEKTSKKDWDFYFNFLEKIVNQLGFGILAVDKQNQIKFLNEKAAQIFRVTPKEIIYQPLTTLLTQKEIDIILSFKDDNIDSIERPELKIEVGEKKKILLGFSVYQYTYDETGDDGYIISLKDITIRKEMEDEKNRIENMNSMGLMTTGIAHEIRNPLAGIKAIAQTLLDELEKNDSHREHLLRIIRLVNRLDDLLKSLYAFARPTKPKCDFISIEKILRNVTNSLQKKLDERNIQIVETFSSSLPDIFVDSDQIKQVFFNVLINSIEAIESDGEIKLTVQSIENSQPISNEHFKSLIQGKPYVKVHIHDNGSGISPTNLQNIFNPFFTTKMLSAGLGLSVAYQTVRQNGGLIYFESEDQKGTECYIILPAYN